MTQHARTHASIAKFFSLTGLLLTEILFQTKMSTTDASQNLFHTFILQIFIETMMGLQDSRR